MSMNFNPQLLMGELKRFQQNPMQYLLNHRFNLPQQYADDPQGAIQYLMNTGRMSQQQFNQLQQMAKQFQWMNK